MVGATQNKAEETLSGDSSLAPASRQKTLASEVQVSGVGLHLGQQTTVRLLPAGVGEGRYFIRTDLASNARDSSPDDSVRIEATVARVIATQLSTELGVGEAQVRTVEHLLSALLALGLDNVRIEITGPELPLLDGSALGWMEAIDPTGEPTNWRLQSASRRHRQAVSELISVSFGNAWVTAYPSEELRFSYGIDFELAAIGNQWHSWSPGPETFATDFAREVAPARTFGLANQIDYLRSQNLIKGGSLENALVCDQDGWLNPPLRFENEPARHKLLDLIGDLSLLGDIPQAHYVAYKASHALHVALAKQLASNCLYSNSALLGT